jgi:hypothetical protein
MAEEHLLQQQRIAVCHPVVRAAPVGDAWRCETDVDPHGNIQIFGECKVGLKFGRVWWESGILRRKFRQCLVTTTLKPCP